MSAMEMSSPPNVSDLKVASLRHASQSNVFSSNECKATFSSFKATFSQQRLVNVLAKGPVYLHCRDQQWQNHILYMK